MGILQVLPDDSADGSSSEAERGVGGEGEGLDSSVDSMGMQSENDEGELFAVGSLIQSSLADKTPRWRQHDSETQASADRTAKGEARDSDHRSERETEIERKRESAALESDSRCGCVSE